MLRELVEDPAHHWRRSWLTTCALYATAIRSDLDLTILGSAFDRVRTIDHDADGIVAETLAALEARLSLPLRPES